MEIDTSEKRKRSVLISSTPNESLTVFIARMVEVARKKIAIVVGHFMMGSKFIELRCGPETDSQDIINAHFAKFEDGSLHPDVTPKVQTECNNAIANLQFMDFSNLREVLGWLHRFSAITNVPGIEYDPKNVIAVFKSHGYEPGINFPGNDQENKGKRIIIACLKELENEGRIDFRMANPRIGKWLKRIYLN